MSVNETWYKLPPDPNQWQQVIVGNLARKVPEIPAFIAGMSFDELDPVMNNADGMVQLHKGVACIPIIVRGGRLAPMDIMVTQDEKFYPVTDAFLDKLYSNNVIGEPTSMQRDYGGVGEGAAQRVEAINTIKRASVETRLKLCEALLESPDAMQLIKTSNAPLYNEIFNPIKIRMPKLASTTQYTPPEVILLSGADGKFTINGVEVPTKYAGVVADYMGLDDAPRRELLKGGYALLDRREKTASLVLPEDMEAMVNETAESKLGHINYATVMGRRGTPITGLLIRGGHKFSEIIPGRTPFDAKKRSIGPNIFINDNGYAISHNMVILDAVTIKDLTPLVSVSSPSVPKVNDVGMFLDVPSTDSNEICCTPDMNLIRILGIVSYGMFYEVHYRDLATMEDHRENINHNSNVKFFTVTDNRLELAKNDYEGFVSMPGQIYSVSATPDGKLVMFNEAMSHSNVVFNMMDTLGLGFEDAVALSDTALHNGRAVFKVAADEQSMQPPAPEQVSMTDIAEQKTKEVAEFLDVASKSPAGGINFMPQQTTSYLSRAELESGNVPRMVDGTSQPQQLQHGLRANQTTGQVPQSMPQVQGQQQQQSMSQAQQSMSQAQGLPQQQGLQQQQGDQTMPPVGDAMQQVPQEQPIMDTRPVDFEGINDIAKVNDPKLMDSYLTGKLIDVNTAGKEQIMQISDDLFEAVQSLSKLLFIIRMGRIDYLNEQDVQMAMNKMSDVIRSIGVAANQMVQQPGPASLA